MRPERRLSGRNGRGGVSRPVKKPFWRNGVKSQGRRGGAPGWVTGTRISWRGAVFKLGWRNIPESRVQPFPIIDTLQELANAGASVVEIAVFVAIKPPLVSGFS